MARIRTIKPEFPQSESMGRCSRDARLLFVNLFTLVDDSGITRGNSRMLASLLFPYDDDAPKLIPRWIDELVREDCIKAYLADGHSYIQIVNWLNHQKIDKPTPSKLPAFDSSREDSRGFVVGREGIKEGIKEGKGGDQDKPPPPSESPPQARKARLKDSFTPNQNHQAIAKELGIDLKAERDKFVDHFVGKGEAKVDWNRTFNNWLRNSKQFSRTQTTTGQTRHEKLSSHIAKLTGQDKRELFDDPGVIHATAERLD